MASLIGDMDRILRLILIVGSICYLGVILFMLKTKKLTVRYAIIWLISGGILLLFSAVPYVVFVLRDILHVEMPVNLVFTLLFGFLLLLSLSLSSTVSCFAEKIKRLTQESALLEKRVRELEDKLNQK